MPVGFIVAAMAIAAPRVGDLGAGAVLVGALLAGLVILDTTLVVISRRRRGVTLLTGGRDHLTHRLLGMVGSAPRVAATLAAVQLSMCAAALGAASLGQTAVLWIAAGAGAAGVGVIAILERRMDRLGPWRPALATWRLSRSRRQPERRAVTTMFCVTT